MTFASFFFVLKHSLLCYCADVPSLFQEFGISYFAPNWRLFIDSLKQSLKAVLPYSENTYPSILIAHSFKTKENYENGTNLLELIKFQNHNLDVYRGLQMIAFLLDLQGRICKAFLLFVSLEQQY